MYRRRSNGIVARLVVGRRINDSALAPARLPADRAERTRFTVPNASATVELVA